MLRFFFVWNLLSAYRHSPILRLLKLIKHMLCILQSRAASAWLFSNEIPFVRLTFCLQQHKVSKKCRSRVPLDSLEARLRPVEHLDKEVEVVTR